MTTFNPHAADPPALNPLAGNLASTTTRAPIGRAVTTRGPGAAHRDTSGRRGSTAEPIAPLGARVAAFAYGLVCYVMFLGVYLYAIGFVGNFLTPTSLDAPARGPLGAAILINLGLLSAFAIQHSVMARPAFKRWWTRFVPPVVERSTYVLFSNICMILLFALWRPMGGVVWDVQNDVARVALYTIFASGWLIVFVSTLLLNHFDLFGLRQVWLFLRGRPYTNLKFHTPAFYRHVRHPLYVGWLIAFWVTPTMTAAHLFFAAITTAYILVAIRLEERDLVAFHGDDYVEYRKRVPMLVPRISPAAPSSATPAA